jgi:thioredoxin-related protein
MEFGYLSSYKEAHAKAIKSNKPLMILFVTTSCPWFQKLKHQVLKKEEVNALIQNAFIPVMIDKETEAFPKALMPFAVPTLTFVEPKEEKKVFQIIGYKPLEEALSLLKQARAKAKEESL